MMDLFVWLEQTGIGTFVRESISLWGYPTILFLHTLGLAIVFGLTFGVNLRILGVGSFIPLGPLQKFNSLVWAGFFINAVSGVLLFVGKATTMGFHPLFWVKIVLIGLGLMAQQFINRKVFRDPLLDKTPIPAHGRGWAVASLCFWTGAIVAGRWMAYALIPS
jgi:hypothetical protein